ncbi:uncharacterized protein [Amphiura filiformis]|uniref:uncharacterized protein n=1 Tax=Amphiura filiformis TaxID=82378 RepID=UPI003B227C93
MAVLIGRCSHERDGLAYTDEKVEERKIFKKILSIDKKHSLAHVDLANNYLLLKEEVLAIQHAKRAQTLEPENPYILHKVGKVFRKAGLYKDALHVLDKACASSKKSDILHQIGLVYRDMYKDQINKKTQAVQEKKDCEEPNKKLLIKAIMYYSQAIALASTHNIALLNRALAYEQLMNLEDAKKGKRKQKAQRDFLNAIYGSNQSGEKVFIRIKYALFHEGTCKDEDEASKNVKFAISDAIQNCTIHPVTRENPKPKFNGALAGHLHRAKVHYKKTMQNKVLSSDPETHSEGLRGLAWLLQAFGEHDAARVQYEEYLCCDGKSSDHDAIYSLVKTLIQLGDFEEAGRWIKELKRLKQADLAHQLTVECALVQGKEAQTQGNHTLATDLFREALEGGSMEGYHKLGEMFIKYPDMSTLQFRIDCAKILHCCEKNNQTDDALCNEIKKLMDFEHVILGKLRNCHLKLEQAVLANQGINQDILDKASDTILEARSMLDRVMFQFQERNYPNLKKEPESYFIRIKQDFSSCPKTSERVRAELLEKLNNYQWDEFDTRFPDLLDFLVKLQPAYSGSNNWFFALWQLVNQSKHRKPLKHSEYDIPIIWNGKKKCRPIPKGEPVYGPPSFSNEVPVDGVHYETFKVVDVARKAAIEVERIVVEFHKYI